MISQSTRTREAAAGPSAGMPTESTGMPRAGAHGTNSAGFDAHAISIRVDGDVVEDKDDRIFNADLWAIAANVVIGTVPEPTGFFGPGF